MGQQKITETEVSEVLLKEDHVLVTQQVQQQDGTMAESLRRIPLSVFGSEINKNAPVTSVNGQTGKVELRPVYLVTLNSSNKAVQPYGDIIAAHRAGYDVKCDYKGYLLPLKATTEDECTFSGIVDSTSHSVVVRSNGSITIYERSLAQKKDIPSKTSQLENDSGYLTKAPVTSVNGKTGDVTVLTPVRVIIEQLADGSYQPDPPHDELEQLHDEGHLLYCQYGNLELPLTHVKGHFLTFSVVDGGNIHTIKIGGSSVQITVDPIKSSDNATGLSDEEKSIIYNLFYQASYSSQDSGIRSAVVQLKKLWFGDTEEPPAADNALLRWDYTQGDILNHGLVKTPDWPQTNASYSLEEDGLLLINNNESKMATFMSSNTYNISDVEITYVVKPVEIFAGKNNAGVPNLWAGLAILNTPYVALSPYHGLSVAGEEKSSYKLPAVDVEYTIKITGGVVYVNDEQAGAIEATEPSKVSIGCNGTMYIKSVSVVPLEG